MKVYLRMVLIFPYGNNRTSATDFVDGAASQPVLLVFLNIFAGNRPVSIGHETPVSHGKETEEGKLRMVLATNLTNLPDVRFGRPAASAEHKV
ncbi:hypothetical protein RAA17_25690 [Komagataeibacter rhaeticus]|nr:hypothetical protein [Komagataeibacter rhaeticus]MDT8873428.1 hypothetical protein [Komagataeibacter rhaeticus]